MLTGFARETVALYASLEHEGQPCWHGVGSLEVAATPERWQDLHRKLGWARSWGVDGRLVSPAEAADLLPLLKPEKILGAYHVPSDGVAKAVWAAAELIRRAGDAVEMRDRTPVVGIDVEGGRVTGVRTLDGRIATDRVLVCCGIWGPRLGRMAGVVVPLVPVEHQLAWTTPLPELAGETREIAQPVLRHQDRDLYFRQRRDHYAVGSYQHEPVVVDPEAIRPHAEADGMPASNAFDAASFAPAWRDAVELLPALGRVEIADAINGMFSFTPDGMPLLGEAADVRGFWSAQAIWITHAGGAAKAIAEWMTHGRAEVDLRECDINRFEPHALSPSYIRTRGAQQYREVYDVIHPLQPLDDPRPLRQSPFAAQERELDAVMFEGRGWEQPRWCAANEPLLERFPVATREGWAGKFWSPIAGAEHLATRAGVTLFDMSPLPKIGVSGPGAAALLERMCSARVARAVGSVTYALLLDERGAIRSDVTVARLGPETFQLGANGPLDLAWLRAHLPADGSAQVTDLTSSLACLGLWGPLARQVVERASDDDWSDAAFPYYSARRRQIGEIPVTALRVSYVGELGWELYVSPDYGGRLWDVLWAAGAPDGLIAAGRAAFDTLRLEKGYRLWGADMQTEYLPDEAGVGFALKAKATPAIGQEAALAARAAGVSNRLCCLTLDDPGVVVMGKEPILLDGEPAGYVTSAGFGFSIGESIAYGYLPASAEPGRRVEIEYFGCRHPATVRHEPLFDPAGTRVRGS
jgi:dimethylglycine oxidase